MNLCRNPPPPPPSLKFVSGAPGQPWPDQLFNLVAFFSNLKKIVKQLFKIKVYTLILKATSSVLT